MVCRAFKTDAFHQPAGNALRVSGIVKTPFQGRTAAVDGQDFFLDTHGLTIRKQ
jgi:hypothetical protein